MRILQVNTFYLPDVGGATVVCASLSRSLLARGHEVRVFCGHLDPGARRSPPPAPRRSSIGDVPVCSVPIDPGAVAPGHPENERNGRVLEAFKREIEEFRPAVVHFHSVQGLGAPLLEAAAAAGAGVVLSVHDWWWICPGQFLPAALALRGGGTARHPAPCPSGDEALHARRREELSASLAAAHRVLAVSGFLRASLAAGGFPRALDVLENGVAPPGAPRPPRAGRGPVRIGYMSGMNSEKGADVIGAAVPMTRGVPGAILVYYGAHGLGTTGARAKPFLQRIRPFRQIPRKLWGRVRPIGRRLLTRVRGDLTVEYRPRYSPEEADRVYADLDAVVVPSIVCESFSLVAREALVRGIPVIASAGSGAAEIVRDGENGLLVPPGDAPALSAAFRRIAREGGLLERLAKGAEAARVRTIGEQADDLEAIYRAVESRPVPGEATA